MKNKERLETGFKTLHCLLDVPIGTTFVLHSGYWTKVSETCIYLHGQNIYLDSLGNYKWDLWVNPVDYQKFLENKV